MRQYHRDRRTVVWPPPGAECLPDAKIARIMSGGQDMIPQIAHLTNSPRKTAAGSIFIVSPDAKIARIMPGGQDMIPQTALLTHSSRETAAGSTFIVSPDAKIARIMSGGQDLIPQIALLTHSPRETAAGSTFIVSPDAKTGPNHARWVGFDTANCPPDEFIQRNSGR